MTIAYLNGEYLPLEEARISPLDRGFLFGDGIYEVIPAYEGKMVGFTPHIERMIRGLAEVSIGLDWSIEQWREVCQQLVEKNGGGNLGLYLHVSRGTDTKRFHAFPDDIKPTVFAYCFEIKAPVKIDQAKGYSLVSTQDLRWQRCHIKSTALLGNVLHFQQGHSEGANETLLYNDKNELTEASSSNILIVKDGVVITPVADNQILPGVTRLILLDVLRKEGSIAVQERVISMDEVKNADEIWVTSSSKEVAPVTQLDGKPVGSGEIGPLWAKVAALYEAHKYSY